MSRRYSWIIARRRNDSKGYIVVVAQTSRYLGEGVAIRHFANPVVVRLPVSLSNRQDSHWLTRVPCRSLARSPRCTIRYRTLLRDLIRIGGGPPTRYRTAIARLVCLLYRYGKGNRGISAISIMSLNHKMQCLMIWICIYMTVIYKHRSYTGCTFKIFMKKSV